MTKNSFQQTDHLQQAQQLEKVAYALSRNGLLWQNNQEFFLRKVCESVADALSIQRVGIFVYIEEQKVLRQIHQFSSENPNKQSGLSLKVVNFPNYFSLISKHQAIASENALLDERLDELHNSYLRPLKITAKIDIAIYKAGKLFGILCVESINQSKLWTDDEKDFLNQVVQLISQRFLYEDLKLSLRSNNNKNSLVNVFNDSPLLCVLSMNSNGIIKNANQTVLDLLNYKKNQLVDTDFLKLIVSNKINFDDTVNDLTGQYNEFKKIDIQTIKELSEQKNSSNSEFLLRDSTGKAIPVSLNIQSIRTNSIEAPVYLCTAVDISQYVGIRKALKEEEARYKHVFNSSSDGIFILDRSTIVDCNDSLVHILRCQRADLIGSDIRVFLANKQTSGLVSYEQGKSKLVSAYKGVAQSFEFEHKRFDDELFYGEISLNRFESKGKAYLLGNMRDISERKRSEREISKSRDLVIEKNRSLDLINTLSNQLHAASSVQDIYHICVNTMSDFEGSPLVTVFEVMQEPYQLQLLITSNHDELKYTKPPCLPINKNFNSIALKNGAPLYVPDINIEKRLMPEVKTRLQKDGYASMISMPLVYKTKEFGLLILTYRDAYPLTLDDIESLHSIAKTISLALANVETRSMLDHIAHHDSLTGLSNRAFFHKQFKQQVLKGGYSTAALFLLDLDRFKEINDTLGHFTGDKILQKIGPRLESIVKNYKFIVSRLGGDEFIMMIYGISDKSEINLIANDILNVLRTPFKIDDLSLEIDTSLGIAMYPRDGMDSHALLRSADVAMYSAKKIGGGFSYYDENIDIHTPERLAMIAEMGSSINSGQLFLHYQPKINIVSKEVVGFEALARWEHPRLGLLNPNMFIPLIEMSNSIDQLTKEVLHQALAQQKEWRKQGKNYSIAVNISARNLIDDSLIKLLEKMLKYYDTDPGMLELEITETALMHDAYRATDYLNQIAKLGVQLSIDDFGTGYSSLSYLQNLPIHKLKLDRKFIMGMLNNYQGSKIVETIITLANTLDLVVIAEGVEDARILNKLRELNCDQAQGYYICRPNTWENIEHWLKRRDTKAE